MEMKNHQIFYLVAGVIALSATVPSIAQSQKLLSHNNPTATVALAGSKAQTQRPPTKTGTIRVEGEKTQVPLKLYKQASPAFSTYYVSNYFVPEFSSSGEGTAVRFFANTTGTKNQDAYVHFFFPARAKSLGQIRTLVNGKGGLIASNRWQVVSRTQKVPYSWAKEKINFQQRKGNQIRLGSVYLGENKGKAFYAIAHYPGEYGDGFAPREDLIFQNVQF